MSFETEQEKFWAGDFGNTYIERNNGQKFVDIRREIFSEILSDTKDVNSILEFGSNIGLNLRALQDIPNKNLTLSAIEINANAIEHLHTLNLQKVYEGSIFQFSSQELGEYDLTFTTGVLIHINPEKLPEVYERLYSCSKKYILVNEYYNPHPVEISYRGHNERMYKRDFAGELLQKYPDLELVSYGFNYHKDPKLPMDDSTWFLLKKS